ncbi:hypothetical protein M9H77_30821 [Catharanthus roseus]|uniref:Uncharacterized protein n=1 Tax=Catharanthus roseus TaxID=4058 RepID=A0ACB9ZYN3_CATRO|nr:hypothetical protein M9H77_30821 [Catharanthus roseus]
MDPNLWSVRMTMRVPSYYEEHHEYYVASSQSESDDKNDEEEEELQTPIIPVTENTKNQWECNQWYSSARKQSTVTGNNQSLIQIKQNKHRNMSSKFISMSILHLVANDPEIPVTNVIEEAQVLFQTGCTYKRAWYAKKFAIGRAFGSRETTFNILPKYLQAVQDSNPRTVYEFLHHRMSSPPNYVFKFVFRCRKWQTYTLPCSHALVVYRENGTRADTYVLEIYLRHTYRRTYQANFNLDFSENFWRDVPYNLTFYPPNMNKERGRK